MSVGVVNDPDTQIVLGAGKTIGVSANGASSPDLCALAEEFWQLLSGIGLPTDSTVQP